MNVYLLVEGDGTDGDPLAVVGVYAHREAAQAEAERRERASWRRSGNDDDRIDEYFAMFKFAGDEWGRYSVCEWQVTA